MEAVAHETACGNEMTENQSARDDLMINASRRRNLHSTSVSRRRLSSSGTSQVRHAMTELQDRDDVIAPVWHVTCDVTGTGSPLLHSTPIKTRVSEGAPDTVRVSDLSGISSALYCVHIALMLQCCVCLSVSVVCL